jgi:hypothetical protein
LDSIFEPGLVPCIHYTFPNAKDAKKMWVQNFTMN